MKKNQITVSRKPQDGDEYRRSLNLLAKQVGDIVDAEFSEDRPESSYRAAASLQAYSDQIGPWAWSIAFKMVESANRSDAYQWRKHSQRIGAGIKRELQSDSAVGNVTRILMEDQVRLIKSLPLEASRRVHDLAMQALSGEHRYSDIAQMILDTEDVTKARATLIARTETSRSVLAFTEARAANIGSEGYIWHVAGDRDTRPSHMEMKGKFVYWNAPPTLDGMTGHAGCLPNCRCWAEVVIPD